MTMHERSTNVGTGWKFQGWIGLGFGALPFLLLFVRVYLLREMHLVLHLLPVLSMVGTLWAVSRLEAVESLLDVLRLQGL